MRTICSSAVRREGTICERQPQKGITEEVWQGRSTLASDSVWKVKRNIGTTGVILNGEMREIQIRDIRKGKLPLYNPVDVDCTWIVRALYEHCIAMKLSLCEESMRMRWSDD